MSRLTLNNRERAVLAKVAEQPRPFGEIDPEHVDILIGYGLVKPALGHYLITPKGQLERQRQSFRAAATGKRARVDGRNFLFLQEARFQGESVPRGEIKERLQNGAPDVENGAAPADAETKRRAGLVGRIRALMTGRRRRTRVEPVSETSTVTAEPEMSQHLPIPFVERLEEPASSEGTADPALERMAEGR